MSGTFKTAEEIGAELAKLRELAPKVKPHSVFGDDNLAAIEAVIEVLEEVLDSDEVHERWGEEAFLAPEEFEQSVLDAAVRAVDWMEGRLADDEEAPSEGWPLIDGAA